MTTPPIDLRSDTVTRPGPGMRAAMAGAEVGDDVFGDDPTVGRLEATLAERLGTEAGLFLASGTQSNLCALLAHCARGEEYLVGDGYHCFKYEAGGAAVLGSIQPAPLPVLADGTLDLGGVAGAIKPDDPHFAPSRLLCLENTNDGRVMPAAFLADARRLADRRGLSVHLDGARIFNAAVASATPVDDIARAADTVSVCLSKGLGAPVGSVLCGPAEVIARARRWRKMVGGGMRQVGILAAAGLYALDHHVDRLVEDHANAARLAHGLRSDGRFELSHEPGARTNMVFARFADPARLAALGEHLATRGILIRPTPELRFVTHLDISEADIETVLTALACFDTP